MSLNREAKRVVESLRTPGRPSEQLLEVVTFRRADGREVSLSELPLAQLLGTAETVRAEEVVLSVPDGRSVRTLVNATPVRAEGGAVRSVVVTMQDLAPLDEIERLRTEFLGLVSHELRAPLIAIKGSADALLEEAAELDPAEMREFFRIIAEQAAHMRGLIRDLLDAGRIDSGTLSVSPEPSEVAALVERARSTFLSGGGRHAVLVDLPAGLPPVMADPRRIVQVLNNLFANAARHAPEPTPIRVAAVREDAHVAVSVSDEGAGVAPERLPHLFSKHAGARQGATAGHGLGLAISKGLVEAHGGRIRAESPGAGRGSTFTFTVPVAGAPGAAAAGHAAGPPAAADRDGPPRILVVDDDPKMLRFVRGALSAAGYAPLVTGAPEDLERIIHTEKPHLVLLDLVLPDVDGIELIQRVPELSDLPVIFSWLCRAPHSQLYCSPSGWVSLYSCQSSDSVTLFRRSSRWISLQSGSGRSVRLDGGAGNSRRSRPVSSTDSGTGQLSPATLARRRYSPTVDGDVPRLRAMARMLNAAAKYSRSTSRILRMDNLLFASVRPSCKSGRVSRPAGRPAPLSSDGG